MPQRKLFDNKTLKELSKHPLRSQDGKGNDAVAYARIFNPYGRGTWYITEYDGNDTMYGYYRENDGQAQTSYDANDEYGYMSKKELEDLRVNVYGVRMPLERDTAYEPANIGQIKRGEGNKPAARRTANSTFANTRTDNAETSAKGSSNG